ncbi:MAG: preprotein translocase subunit SecG [Candidatus Omnitrophica bacterium]|nr:preprotein translocase subunit SecG [Candidatus Omnitrophota bacterium]
MGLIVFIHIVVCVLLVISILMQAGRGGGLAESFASAESMFGTQTNAFMVRLSTILAVIFFCTSLILAVSSSKGDKSLMAHAKLPAKTASSAKEETKEEPTVKVSEPKPISAAEAKPVTTTPITNTAK